MGGAALDRASMGSSFCLLAGGSKTESSDLWIVRGLNGLNVIVGKPSEADLDLCREELVSGCFHASRIAKAIRQHVIPRGQKMSNESTVFA